MKRKALEEAQKYTKFVLEARVETFDYSFSDKKDVIRRPITEIIRKNITYKELEDMIKKSVDLIDTFIVENDRHIRIGIDKLVICREKKD